MAAGLTKNKNPLQFNLCKSRRKTHFADFNLIEVWRSLFRRAELRAQTSRGLRLSIVDSWRCTNFPKLHVLLLPPRENFLVSRWTRYFQLTLLREERVHTLSQHTVQCIYFVAKQRWGHLQSLCKYLYSLMSYRGQSSVLKLEYTIFHRNTNFCK